MQNKIAGAIVIILFILSTFVEGAKAQKPVPAEKSSFCDMRQSVQIAMNKMNIAIATATGTTPEQIVCFQRGIEIAVISAKDRKILAQALAPVLEVVAQITAPEPTELIASR